MTDLPERMVEAGARAIAREHFGTDAFEALNAGSREQFRKYASACLIAALALAEGEGAILTVVPEPAKHQAANAAGQYVIGAAEGFNSCRAVTLAGKVTL